MGSNKMRKAFVVVIAVVSLFALAAVAASQLTVVGVSNPLAGSASAASCNPGTVTVAAQNDGTDVTGFTLTTASNTTSCTGYTFYVKVAATGADAPANGYYFMSITAAGNYTSGTAFTFAGSDVYDDYPSTTNATAPAIEDVTIGTSRVLLSQSAPSGSTAGPSGWGA
jgi:hypothetical protein